MTQRIAIATVMLLVSVASSGHGETSDYVVEAPRLSEPPVIDGRLDEKVWEEAVLLDRFVQVQPEEGAPPTERTEVRIGYDEKKLYLGVRCFYSEPDKIVAIAMERDQRLAHDDTVKFIFDTFLDHKSGFSFAVNAVGAQNDALVRLEGDDVNLNWDGIWHSATSRDTEGWIVEIAIPFRTLRFPKKKVHTWGFNIARTIVHKREHLIWKPVPRYSGGESIYKLGQAGGLTGLQGLQQGKGFDIVPYTLARWDRSDTGGDDTSFDAGVDLKKYITSNLVLDLTYNLDFAEAEADQQQINLTRFKLYFPEKRDFFLEGENLFYFGERTDPLKSPDKIFFFSRRIGLSDDAEQVIPVLGGAKLSGQIGATGIGFLNLTTDEMTYTDRAGTEQYEPRTNYTALRLKRNVLEKSGIGLIWLNKEVNGGVDTSGTGVDWDLSFGDHLKTGGFLARSPTPGGDGEDWAGMVDVVWDSRFLFLRSHYSEIGDNFNPAMGFFPRLGVREFRTYSYLDFRPDKWNLRTIYLWDDFTRVADLDGNLESQLNRVGVDFFWNNFIVFSAKVFDEIEVLDLPFEISKGVIIPPGRYHFQNYFVGAQSIPAKPLFAYARHAFGEFYDGTFKMYFVALRIRPFPGFTAQIEFEHNDVELPAGDFDIDFVTAHLVYSISPLLSFRTRIQWDRDDEFDAQILFRWQYRPGAAFYLVYTEFRDLANQPGGLVSTEEKTLISKLSFTF